MYTLRTYICLFQTYGIVQQDGQVEYMTFVLSVEEDGPAYMAGLRPGKSSTHETPKIFALQAHNIVEFDIPTFPTNCHLPFTQVSSYSRYPSLPSCNVLFIPNSVMTTSPSPSPPPPPPRFLYFLHSVLWSSQKLNAEVGGLRRRRVTLRARSNGGSWSKKEAG